jgi:hypothetical protein
VADSLPAKVRTNFAYKRRPSVGIFRLRIKSHGVYFFFILLPPLIEVFEYSLQNSLNLSFPLAVVRLRFFYNLYTGLLSSLCLYVAVACQRLSTTRISFAISVLNGSCPRWMTIHSELTAYLLGKVLTENVASENILNCCVRVCCSGKVFREPLPGNKQEENSVALSLQAKYTD